MLNPAKIPAKALPKVMESISARMPNQPHPRLGQSIMGVAGRPSADLAVNTSDRSNSSGKLLPAEFGVSQAQALMIPTDPSGLTGRHQVQDRHGTDSSHRFF